VQPAFYIGDIPSAANRFRSLKDRYGGGGWKGLSPAPRRHEPKLADTSTLSIFKRPYALTQVSY
jgi:hypothetical protein